jgi:K+-sensing histidine kinase KdpD
VLLTGRLLSSFDDPRAWVRVPLRLSTSIAAVGLALWVTGVLEPVLGRPAIFPAFVGIVFISAGIAGLAYGLATTALFGLGYAFLFQEPRRGFAVGDPHELAVLVVYAASGFAVAVVGSIVRKAYARAREDHRAVVTIHEQREDLLKTLTHDVRSPLSVITMNAAMLARDSTDPAIVQRRARAIEKSAARVARMLGDLIDTAYLESGQLPLDRKPLALAGFVRELRSRLEGTLPIDRVTFDVPENLPAADVDAGRFERILVNLLSNALKYAPPPAPIALRAAVQEREVVVSVADGGAGIAQQDLPHLFEKYFRASSTREKEGLGIGLYATRLLVQAHGGRIWADSAPGKGSTFYVAVPTATRGERTVGAGVSPEAPAHTPALPLRQKPTTAGSDSDHPAVHSR